MQAASACGCSADVIVKAHSVELVHFEHPSFYDSLQRANQDMGGRIVALMRSLVEVLGSATGMIAVLAVLWQAHWSLAPIMVVGVAPGFWVMLAMRKKTWWCIASARPKVAFRSTLPTCSPGGTTPRIRLFTLARHLLTGGSASHASSPWSAASSKRSRRGWALLRALSGRRLTQDAYSSSHRSSARECHRRRRLHWNVCDAYASTAAIWASDRPGDAKPLRSPRSKASTSRISMSFSRSKRRRRSGTRARAPFCKRIRRRLGPIRHKRRDAGSNRRLRPAREPPESSLSMSRLPIPAESGRCSRTSTS